MKLLVNLPRHLALNQIRQNPKRTAWTLFGIVLSTAMITAVYGFAASGIELLYTLLEGTYVRQVYYNTMYSIGGILSLVIAITSIIVVSNSFRVSAGRRMAQFGILKSVGATKKQIAHIILWESAYYALVGIPIGVLLGIGVHFIGIALANYILQDVMRRFLDSTIFTFTLAWGGVVAAVVVALFTVLVSAWLPARKAAKVPAIDAIRGVGEVTIKAKKVRTSKIIHWLFGFEGALAAKSIKRSRRNLRATVISITISIVLFIGVSSFVYQLNRMTQVVFFHVDADVIGELTSLDRDTAFPPAMVDEITARLRALPDTEVVSLGFDMGPTWFQSIQLPADMATPRLTQVIYENTMGIHFVSLDPETYARLCEIAGVPLGSNILVNHFRTQIDGNWTEFTPFNFDYQLLTFGEGQSIPLHGQITNAHYLADILHSSRNHLTVIASPQDTARHFWHVETDNHREVADYMRTMLAEVRDAHTTLVNTHVREVALEENIDRAIVRAIMVFGYGFVIMLTLVGLTNVISTLSTNIRTRAREIAVLKSVGMTQAGLNRMLNLEAILTSGKSLMYGLPLGLLVSLLMHRGIGQSVIFTFPVPWVAMLQCIAGVFVITWVTMRVAAGQLRGRNIVDDVRGVE